MLLFPPPSSKDVFFFVPFLSTRLPGRGTLPFVSSLFIFPLLFSLSLIHRAQKGEEEGEGVFYLGQETTGKNGHKKVNDLRREGEREKGRVMK